MGANVEITPAMVAAGVLRMRESLPEFEQSLADVLVVLEVLDAALRAGPGVRGSSLSSASKEKILADSLQCLEDI